MDADKDATAARDASANATAFAADLQRQFEGLTERAPGPLSHSRWILMAAVATAVAVTAAAILVLSRPGAAPGPQLAAGPAAPTAVSSPAPGSGGTISGRPADIPDVTTVSLVALDPSGRLWLAGRRADEGGPFIAYPEDDQWMFVPDRTEAEMAGPLTALSTDDLWVSVTGGFAHWDGATWQKTSIPLIDWDITWINDMAAATSNDVWAVGPQRGGLYKSSGDGPGEHTIGTRPLTMHWDGTAWSEIEVPAMPGRTSNLQAVSTNGGETWSVGSYEQKLGEREQQGGLPMDVTRYGPIALRWDGDSWRAMQAPARGAAGTDLRDVLALGPGDVWVLGRTFEDDEHTSNYVAHWDGSTWSMIATPNGRARGDYWSIAGTSDDDLWLAGDGAGGSGFAEAAHWNGTEWTVFAPETFKKLAGGGEVTADGAPAAIGSVGSGMPDIAAVGPSDVWFNAGFTRLWRDESRLADAMLFHWDGSAWTKVDVPF